MSSLFTHMRRLFAAWFPSPSQPQPTDPDTMCLRDWADLPPYHPLCAPSAVLRPQSGR